MKMSLIIERVKSRTKSVNGEVMRNAGTLSGVDPKIAKSLVIRGLDDGDKLDDKVSIGKKTWPASSLKPSQTSMILGKALGMALFMLKSGKVGGDLGALVSSDMQIMDGHHRWSATILASGKSGKVGGYGAEMSGRELLRLLNVITKGKWRVMVGKPGKGSIDKFTSSNVREMLTSFTEEGIKGEFPWSAEDVKGVLAKAFGSVEKGIATMSSNAKLISKRVPGWAPGRKDMPVIDPGNVPATVKMIKRGEVDHRSPHAEDLQGGLGQAIMEGIEMAGSMAKLSGV